MNNRVQYLTLRSLLSVLRTSKPNWCGVQLIQTDEPKDD